MLSLEDQSSWPTFREVPLHHFVSLLLTLNTYKWHIKKIFQEIKVLQDEFYFRIKKWIVIKKKKGKQFKKYWQ